MSDKLKRLFIPGIMDALLPTVEWVQEQLGGKVDKVTGKGLSENDFTTADKGKLDGVESGAEKNKVSSVNNKTGAVDLNAQDVGAVSSETYTADKAAMQSEIIGKADLSAIPTSEINANTAARHAHGNKALLDTYTQTEANLSDAVSKKHSHSNKETLDGITSAKVAAWDGKADASDIPTSLSELADDAAHRVVSDSEILTWNAKYSKPSAGIPASDIAPGVIPEAEGNFEKIAEITFDGETPFSVIDTDMDGNGFQLKRAMIVSTIGAASAAGSYTIAFKTVGGYYEYVYRGYTNYAANTAGRKAFAEAYSIGGLWFGRHTHYNNNGYGTLQIQTDVFGSITTAENPYIDAVQTTAAWTPPNGTKFTLYGIRV